MAVRGSGAGCPIVFVWTCALSGASLCRVLYVRGCAVPRCLCGVRPHALCTALSTRVPA